MNPVSPRQLTGSQSVLIDDTDPSIVYSPADSWTLQNVNFSHISNSLDPPLYGTLHQSGFGAGNLTFTFTGVAMTAVFSNADKGSPISCTLDGQAMIMEVKDSPPRLLCVSNVVQLQRHEFVVTKNASLEQLLFDYLQYFPTITEGNVTMTDSDIMYSSTDPSIKMKFETPVELSNFGDTCDFTFVGYSLSVYTSFYDYYSHNPSSASYSIDGNTPVNFTMSNPATNLTTLISGMIVLQTPRYSLSQHHFHLDFWGNSSTVPFNLEFMIVQNTTKPQVILDSFPPISTLISSTNHEPSTFPPQSMVPSSGHLGPIIGGATAGVVILFTLLTFFLYRQLRKNRASRSSIDAIVPETEQKEPNVLIEPFYQWPRSIQSSSRKHRAQPSRSNSNSADTQNIGSNNMAIAPRRDNVAEVWNGELNLSAVDASQRHLQYRIHEDSGEQITQPDEGTVVVDLPPTYTTIGFTADQYPAVSGNESREDSDAVIEQLQNVVKV